MTDCTLVGPLSPGKRGRDKDWERAFAAAGPTWLDHDDNMSNIATFLTAPELARLAMTCRSAAG
jgi:hypothetical protein